MTARHLDLVLAHPDLADLDPGARRVAIAGLVAQAGLADPDIVAAELADYVDGFGPLTEAMADPEVTDVFVNGAKEVLVDRRGRIERCSTEFADDDELHALVEKLFGDAGARLDWSRPIADARLKDGSRIHAVLPPIAPRGPIVSIRRFRRAPFSLDDLEASGMFTSDGASRLARLVDERASVVVAGATGAGKTTLLNALILRVAPYERIVLVEETPELRPARAHVVSLLAREATPEGAGAIGLEELLRAALRMRPDRIIVGEVRGPEALTAMVAFSTGHAGSMLTVHARSAEDTTDRLVSLALSSPFAPSEATLRREMSAAFDAVVFVERRDGRRVVARIDER